MFFPIYKIFQHENTIMNSFADIHFHPSNTPQSCANWYPSFIYYF